MMLAGNTVFNWHVHKSCDGALIVHAHPFKSADSGTNGCKHSHNSNECFSIKQITNFFFVLAACIIVTRELGKIVEITKIYHYQVKKNLLAALLPNRAPPVLA